MRAFIAVKVPDSISGEIAAAMETFNDEGVKKSRADDHITLFFFRDLSDEQAEKVIGAMASVAPAPFDISVTGINTFNPKRPDVLFATVKSVPLAKIYDELKEKLERLGLETDKRGFTPHITIARRSGASSETFRKIMGFISKNNAHSFGSFPCNGIELVKSTLTKDGPVHAVIFEKRLVPPG